LDEELSKEQFNVNLKEKERNLIGLIRKIQHGELRVIIQDGIPTRVEELKRSIKL
jgi:hypothetical protein